MPRVNAHAAIPQGESVSSRPLLKRRRDYQRTRRGTSETFYPLICEIGQSTKITRPLRAFSFHFAAVNGRSRSLARISHLTVTDRLLEQSGKSVSFSFVCIEVTKVRRKERERERERESRVCATWWLELSAFFDRSRFFSPLEFDSIDSQFSATCRCLIDISFYPRLVEEKLDEIILKELKCRSKRRCDL